MANTEPKARIDLRLPAAQKELFERAAILGGYRNLTDFMLAELQKGAEKVVKDKEQIIANQLDSDVFFDAILNPRRPNEALKKALEKFKKTY
ncbi:MAG: DUF1778 domain-containing protein [Flexibacteraceae bacterium]